MAISWPWKVAAFVLGGDQELGVDRARGVHNARPRTTGTHNVSSSRSVNLPDDGADAASTEAAAPTELALRLAARIDAEGPLSFHDFMAAALYTPGLGYYARARTPWSESADFVTAPQVDAAVGGAVASLASECDQALGAPPAFGVIEFGGGDGALMGDFCDAVRDRFPRLYDRLRVTCIEQGEAARWQQRERLLAHRERVDWIDDVRQLPAASVTGLALSNEFLDALPVHRVVQRGDTLREICVDREGAGFVEIERAAPAPLVAYLADNGVTLAAGQIAEICLGVGEWIAAVAARLRRGYVLTIDYGAESGALYGPARRAGSLVCQHRYQLNASPYERVGEQDITAHIDWGNLRRHAAQAGLADGGICGLAVFLLGFGAATGLRKTTSGDDVRRRLGLRHLLFTEISDAHRVMLLAADVEPIPFGVQRLASGPAAL